MLATGVLVEYQPVCLTQVILNAYPIFEWLQELVRLAEPLNRLQIGDPRLVPMRSFRGIIHRLLPSLHHLNIEWDVALLDRDIISLREHHRGVIFKHLDRPAVYVSKFLIQLVCLARGPLEPLKERHECLSLSVKEGGETQGKSCRYEVVKMLSVKVPPQE